MSDFKQYRRKQIAELRAWQPGDDMTGISVSGTDLDAGSPKRGDMIARNPKNHADQWLVAAAYFADNFESARDPLENLTDEDRRRAEQNGARKRREDNRDVRGRDPRGR